MFKYLMGLILVALLSACTQEREAKTYTPVNPLVPQRLSYAEPTKALIFQETMTPSYPVFYGGQNDVVFSISPALPAGLQFSSLSGRIAGTPEELSVSPVEYVVTAENSYGSVSTVVTLSVKHKIPYGLSYGNETVSTIVGGLINVTPTCNEGDRMQAACLNFSISPALPSGLNFNPNTGRIVGTISSKYKQSFVITASNTGGSVSTNLTIDIRATLSALTAGLNHSCVKIANDVHCWGDNTEGQLGDGTQVSKFTPTKINLVKSFTELTAGDDFTCAYHPGDVDVTRSSYCWGGNRSGAFQGLPSLRYLNPVQLPETLNDMSASKGGSLNRLCGINSKDGFLASYCYGSYNFGSLGAYNYRVENSSGAFNYTSKIASGGDFTCLFNPSSIWCQGSNDEGQLGTTAVGASSVLAVEAEVPVSLGSSITSMSAFGKTVCFIKNNIELYCWGEHFSPLPTLVDISSVSFPFLQQVEVGNNVVCVNNVGQVYCRGLNDQGQLGTGSDNTMEADFALVKDGNGMALENVSSFALGEKHGCANVFNELYCWGSNDKGQIGQSLILPKSNKALRVSF